jgi:hypothetical protein
MRFRVRSPARDRSADAGRLSSIEQSILKAIAEAEAERNGIARRLEAARARAAVLLGSDTSDYGTRDPKGEQLLQLTAHIGHMGQVLDVLKRQ